ncbi:ferric-dicitrate binding protein FerR, regulates iron transport through sigma-19 [Parapedobacter composti]|uniref:Ferric-dicitrate binding protein FerR, regulates iron transport through sigma-19 n=1 Tax=Parapedobacter composti TaxID=623281 RepID=A0A1I1L5D9_9SPHI|nr:FecR domain-containing protein [Parapedobacter composti]SFC68246.1 ferric-dicitrate binding protein FerR, regulates iron transport through sigma-19 [Parapedobacter composti]
MENGGALKNLFQKLTGGTASRKEQQLIAQWLDQLDGGEEMDKQALEAWEIRSMAELRAAIKPKLASRQPTRKLVWMGAVAAVLLAVLGIWSFRLHLYHPSVDKLPAVDYVELRTGAGQRKLVTLSDGSRIWLGNASSVRYPKGFQQDRRDVFLEGQAFFEVAPDSTKPFWVHTNGLDIQVLGTSFDVKNYEGEVIKTVTVATGKVLVQPQHAGKEWTLGKGDQIICHATANQYRVQPADLTVALAWKNGELIFRDTPLEEIATQLQRWYGADINIVSRSLLKRRLSLSVKDEPLQRVLNMLAVAGAFRFDIQGRKVEIWNEE